MTDYLDIEYSNEKRPTTTYPSQLAEYLFNMLSLKPGYKLLEFGSGRAELLAHFTKLGLETYALDDAPSSKLFADNAGANFELFTFKNADSISNLPNRQYDVIFSKSFVEHISNPIEFAVASHVLLKPGGLFVTLTPDWESNKSIFYDDLTHIKPFSRVAMQQLLEYGKFEIIEVKRFRQLPITWRSSLFNFLAAATSMVSTPRARNKWFRWSRELMIIGVGRKPLE